MGAKLEIVINLNEAKPFKVEKYSEKAKYSYSVDNEKDPNFEITEQEWKGKTWIEKVSKNQKTIFLIDGRQSSEMKVRRLSSDEIFTINIHKDEKTIKQYDRKADNVVIIKTKKQIKNVSNLDKDLELLLSDRKAFDRIASKYPIYVDDVLLTKKQLKNFDAKTIRSMYVDENATEIKLTTRKSESETFVFKIEDESDSTLEELKNHINKINQQKKDSLFSSNKIQVQKLNDKDTHVTLKGIGSASTQKIVYIVDGKEMNSGDFRKIHPNDIERIDVLKDQSTKEKYGDKAKDGVLVITTKAKKEVSFQQKKQALKARELEIKKRQQITHERKKQLSQLKNEREKQRQQLTEKRNEISEKTQQRRKELEKARKETREQ